MMIFAISGTRSDMNDVSSRKNREPPTTIKSNFYKNALSLLQPHEGEMWNETFCVTVRLVDL